MLFTIVVWIVREHFAEYKEICKKICRLTYEVQREYEKLINLENADPNDTFGFQVNPFEDGVGDFWLILDTRNYCHALNSLASEMGVGFRTSIGTVAAH